MEQGQVNIAITIPYNTKEERIRIVGREIRKGRVVEVWDELKIIYSAKRWRCGNNEHDSRK